MPFIVPIDEARSMFPQFIFLSPLTPSEQKAAFHVRDTNGTDLCLKIIAPNYDIDRLQREILALQSLSHPNIVRLIEYTFSSRPEIQRHYVIEEFIEGQDLRDDIVPGQPWDLNEATPFFISLFDGLNALNMKQLVHRDLKPNNIRVKPDNSPVIIDFGLARHLSLSDLTTTRAGAAIGTPAYFAPEQFQGNKHDIDHRTDLYAVGTILFEVLVGHHPFHSVINSYSDLQDAVCNSSEYLRDSIFVTLPVSWQLIISKLLEKERVRRPLNASQVVTILQRIGG